jgi:hypothetical protein
LLINNVDATVVDDPFVPRMWHCGQNSVILT